eukprot:778847-Prorocentrum_minimum.AAC.2
MLDIFKAKLEIDVVNALLPAMSAFGEAHLFIPLSRQCFTGVICPCEPYSAHHIRNVPSQPRLATNWPPIGHQLALTALYVSGTARCPSTSTCGGRRAAAAAAAACPSSSSSSSPSSWLPCAAASTLEVPTYHATLDILHCKWTVKTSLLSHLVTLERIEFSSEILHGRQMSVPSPTYHTALEPLAAESRLPEGVQRGSKRVPKGVQRGSTGGPEGLKTLFSRLSSLQRGSTGGPQGVPRGSRGGPEGVKTLSSRLSLLQRGSRGGPEGVQTLSLRLSLLQRGSRGGPDTLLETLVTLALPCCRSFAHLRVDR